MSDTVAIPSTANFDQFGLSADILKAIAEQGYTTPTPIQEQAKVFCHPIQLCAICRASSRRLISRHGRNSMI